MGNGWHEWPLVIFTVLGQCVVGALIVSGIGWFAAKNDADRQRIVRGMFFLWLLMGIGFIASVMHLGSPLRAFNSLNRIGASGLSNEIAAGSIFFAVGGLWWLVAVIGNYASLQVWRVVLLCAGLGCWLCPLIRRREPHVAGLILGLILILGGEMIGRVLFYGLHMTVGMAIAG